MASESGSEATSERQQRAQGQQAQGQQKAEGAQRQPTQQQQQQQGEATGRQPSRQQTEERRGLARRELVPALSGFGFAGANPFSLLGRMMGDLDRLFEALLSGTQLAQRFGQAQDIEGPWAPRVEVHQRDGQLTVRAELPGIRPDDIRIEIRGDALVLEGERRHEVEAEEEQRGLYRSERFYGAFRRIIPLPEGVDVDQTKARFENGVLEVTLPMPQAEAAARRIPIEGSKEAPAVH